MPIVGRWGIDRPSCLPLMAQTLPGNDRSRCFQHGIELASVSAKAYHLLAGGDRQSAEPIKMIVRGHGRTVGFPHLDANSDPEACSHLQQSLQFVVYGPVHDREGGTPRP